MDIKYNFIASGQADVTNVFRSVTYEAQRMARESSAAFQQVNAGMRTLTRSTGQPAPRAAGPSQAEQTARALARNDAQRERSKKSAFEKEGRDLEKLSAKYERELAKQTAAEARELKKREQMASRHAKAQERIQNEQWRSMTGGIGRGLKWGLGGAVLGGMGLVGAAINLTSAPLRESLALDDQVRRLAINSRGAGQRMEDPAKLRREIQAMALATPGQKSSDIAGALASFVGKTGDLGSARRFGSTFATAASASGADVNDIATASADLYKKFGITSGGDMKEALAALIFQGKSGSFELKDAAGQYSALAASASRFGLGKGVKGVRTLGGLTQIAREATKSPESAATALQATMRQFVNESDKIKQLAGVDVFTDASKTKTRDIQDLIVGTIGGTKGNLGKLQSIFQEEGIQALSPMIATYNQAGGGKAGESAVRRQLDDAINATGKWTDVQEDAAAAQESTSARLTAAWETVVSQVSEKVMPAVTQMLEQFSKTDGAESLELFVTALGAAAEGLGSLVQFLEDRGLITKRVQNPREKFEKALKAEGKAEEDYNEKRTELDEYDGEVSRKRRAGTWTAMDEKEYNRRRPGMVKDMNKAQDKWSAAQVTRNDEYNATVTTPGKAFKHMTRRDVAKAWLKAKGDEVPTDERVDFLLGNESGDNFLKSQIDTMENEAGGANSNDRARKFLGTENEEQARIRAGYQDQVNYQNMQVNRGLKQLDGIPAGPAIDEAEIMAKLQRLGAAADKASTSLEGVKPSDGGSIHPTR